MIDKKFVTHNRDPFFDLATAYIKPDSKVLDIGPGKGDFSDFHKRTDFYLFEGNPESVAVLLQKHQHVVHGMLPDLPFEDRFFDLIHCSHVVEHLQPQVFYDSLKEMDRCLHPGGKLIISAPLMWEGFYDDLSHVRPYNPKVYVRYLCNADTQSRTRGAISFQYKVVSVHYRYIKTDVFPLVFNDSNNIIGTFFLFGIKMMRKMGLKRYQKTAYTITLEKMAI